MGALTSGLMTAPGPSPAGQPCSRGFLEVSASCCTYLLHFICLLNAICAVFDLVKLHARLFKEKTYNSRKFIGLRFQAKGNKISSENIKRRTE